MKMSIYRRTTRRTEPPAPEPETKREPMSKTIAQFDGELEAKQEVFHRLHGEIEQLRMERAFELLRLAREQARNVPAPTYQPARWNDAGFVNDFSEEIT
jgi:hypothetical protein